MPFERGPDPVILGCLVLSILLHLLLLLVLPQLGQKLAGQEPFLVEVVPPRRTPPDRPRELDLPKQAPPVQRREQPAKRLGPEDQVVKRETAPAGKDREDTPRSVRAAPSRPPAAPAATPSPAEVPRPVSPLGEMTPAGQKPAPARGPSLEELTTLAPNTMARLESDWRRQYREGVAKGDTVWLDTEQDLLISFFKRFKINLYNVWNYPEGSRRRGEEGTCLMRIVVSRQGTIDDVVLLESSGVRDLDEEVIRAVRKGAPYGPLPAAYPHPQLKIMATFHYSLNRRPMIYGERP